MGWYKRDAASPTRILGQPEAPPAGHLDPGILKRAARQSEKQRETSGNSSWQLRALQKTSEGQRGDTPRAGELQCKGGSIWAPIWGYNLPRVPRGTNLLRPSSEAELPIISVSHQARGTRQTVPHSGREQSPQNVP